MELKYLPTSVMSTTLARMLGVVGLHPRVDRQQRGRFTSRDDVQVRWCSWLSRSSHIVTQCSDHERSPVRTRVEPIFE